jgi:hypothetical protein
MFRNDWSIKPNGEEYLDLVFNEWWTDEDVDADALGEALVRAFKGEHDIAVSWGEFSDLIAATLTDGGLELEIAMPFLLGDYNRDGSVDAADYVAWRKTLGNSVATAGMGADGNHNGIIDMGDYAMWRAHLGAVMPSGAGSAAVPEPTAVILALIGCAISGFWRRRAIGRGLAK